ncbi:MAG TPA: type II secretion system protein [Candidatus Saccharimonadaceae bacterium]|nr:type II secretion system protein [Candidatus Saccharimonadaceae bacterium]
MDGSSRKRGGFTLVELLIVIVVIGILAAITLVAYNGVQTKANNAATESAASDALKLLTAYTTMTGSYPSTSSGCLAPPSGAACLWGGTTLNPSAALTTALNTIGTPPANVPNIAETTYSGITYNYNSARTVDGTAAPAFFSYTLSGKTTCPVGHIVNGGGNALTTSAAGYTLYTASGNTLCIATIPGP